MVRRTVEAESGTERDQVTLGELMKISAVNESVSLIANIGVIGSSTWSPYLECGVGIVRLDLDNIEIGTKVDVIGINGEKLMAEICSLPMYDEKGLILRGIDKNIPNKSNPWFEK